MKRAAITTLTIMAAISCSTPEDNGKVTLVTLDPGHFHAALVQKSSFPQVSDDVYVYAPEGPDVKEHLKKIEGYNKRSDSPTAWNEIVYTGDDYLEKMLKEKKGDIMVTAGNNKLKTRYIKESLEAGFNVLADKPMAIDSKGFELLKDCFKTASEKGLLLYDIMTERFEISSILQRELTLVPEIFGTMEAGTEDNPAAIKESVHHFYKNVSGNALIRPAWFYDVDQQGEGIVDVMTHLVDIVQWECFPDQAIDYTKDIEVTSASHWCTTVDKEQFKKSTGLDEYPEFLNKDIHDGILEVFANGEINYKLKGICAKVIVKWAFEPPAGGGDTHYSAMRGSLASIVIRQGAEQNFKPELYIEAVSEDDAYKAQVSKAFAGIAGKYPGVSLEPCDGGWHVVIPDSYRDGHEAHFNQVALNFLDYMKNGNMPEWEVPNMLAKYYTTTKGLEIARQQPIR